MAFTATKVFETVVGNKIWGCYKLTGDGSDTTWSVPVGVIDAAWLQPYTANHAFTTATMSFTTDVVTFDSAPESGDYVLVFYIGN